MRLSESLNLPDRGINYNPLHVREVAHVIGLLVSASFPSCELFETSLQVH